MIDAAVDIETGVGSTFGDTGSSDYTTVGWETGAGKGLTVAPAGGDTGKTLVFLNAGTRGSAGNAFEYGTAGRFFSGTQSDASYAWYLVFREALSFGQVAWGYTKLYAFSLRCVRS